MSLGHLPDYLHQMTQGQPVGQEVASAIMALSDAAKKIASLAASNGIGGDNLSHLAGGVNEDGDSQKQLDVLSDKIVQDGLRSAGVAIYFSEEEATPITLNQGQSISVACDPLDGSSNIDTNLTIGTIFSVFRTSDCQDGLPPYGRKQIASGFFVYGPQTALLLSFGSDVRAFALSQSGVFAQLDWQVQIPKASAEFAINASNAAFWPDGIKAYIDELSRGEMAHRSGMRWLGSLVADAFRIFRRGGLFLYPEDSRKGYEQGRLRLIYEANPIAFMVEAAGGTAIDGVRPILDIKPDHLHQRIPFIFGSAEMVDELSSHLFSHEMKDQ